ncbi:MAG TPA: LLM class flavin-dependent oxidoreductase [Stellaceae bacterium]|nr:LLM class flavin-dependent oxidoreductase [Stellaceae bacterium]
MRADRLPERRAARRRVPTGLPTDATISNGVVPVEQRERYREALQLVLKAWQAREVFAWNGKHYQLPMVNLWPRPIQQPHPPNPPIWIPGSGSATTVEFVVERDDCFCHLSYFGAKNETLGDYYWDTVAQRGRDANPYRLGFLQLIGVSESDAAAEEYAPHVEYFFRKLLYTPQYYQAIPGYQDHAIPRRHLGRRMGRPLVAGTAAGPSPRRR